MPANRQVNGVHYSSDMQTVIRMPDGTSRRLLREVFPRYSASERRAKVQGKVIVRARINPDGSVTPIAVVSAPDPALAESATRAVAQWRFEPDPKHRTLLVDIPVTFGLKP